MIVWIEKPLIMLLHDRQLVEHGGLSGVRDERLLESALARPQQLLAYSDPPPDLAALAASLTHGIAKNNAFVDGNKRSAIVSCETFIELNGATLDAQDVDVFTAILGHAQDHLTEAAFAEWLRAHIRMDLDADKIQEPKPRYRKAVKKTAGKSKAR